MLEKYNGTRRITHEHPTRSPTTDMKKSSSDTITVYHHRLQSCPASTAQFNIKQSRTVFFSQMEIKINLTISEFGEADCTMEHKYQTFLLSFAQHSIFEELIRFEESNEQEEYYLK
ncbi:Hypothetical predicted protein [Octopus vulgaris]|uniref:Uncharacterized protein n=1 Tax=Octopus vulgaris TaxID=6645 RepID=A0AA36F658_OCTVU|nr:Hypothetical predicted protein [Octopus vulgaris]